MRGFTLVELAVSMAVMSILMLAMGSALLVATQALPDADRSTTKVNQASQIAEQIITELQEARHITEQSAQAIAFTVADRNGDGSPERVRYAWSGTGGDPLTRQYNFGTEVAVLADVNTFALTYDLHTDLEQYPGPPIYGSEILLNSYTAADSLSEFNVKSDEWIGQYFQPPGGVFPGDAVYWRVTRVKFQAKQAGSPYQDTYVQLRPPDDNHKPTDTILEQQVMYEGDLTGSWVWQDFSFTGAHDLEPGADLCLVLQGTSGTSAQIRREDDDEDGVTGRLKTTDGGSSWEYLTDKCMRYEIYGKVATPSPDQTATRQYVTGIRLQLQSGTDAHTRIDTAVHLPNMPELLSVVWELDFNTDPTALNMNGDATNDWSLRSGSFDPGDLVNGVWIVDGATSLELDTVPDNSFTDLTTIDLRFRCTEISGSGVYFWINADYTGGNFMPIVVTLDKLNSTTQKLTVKIGGSNVVTVSGLSADFVDLRLLIDPDLDTVNIKINSINQGTFAYAPYAPSGDPQRATLHEWGSDAEWDYVRIRVGGNNP